MATKPATRRKRQPTTNTEPRGTGRAKAPTTPASAQAAAPEETVQLAYPEADPVLADAADRAADLRNQALDDVARILADGQLRATVLLDGARTEAASITEAATAEQARLLAVAATDADRVRTEAATTAVADAGQVRADAEATAEQLLADARLKAGTVVATAAGEADQVIAGANTAVEQLLADARRQAQEVAATAAVQAEQVRTDAAQAAAKALADAEAVRTELLAAAERTAVQTRTRATTDADQLLRQARGEADRLRESADGQAAQVKAGALKAAAELREDATREREAARADAARTRTLAKEDIGRLRATAAEDAERLTRAAREEAARILDAARTKRDTDLAEAGQALAQARLREADADVTFKAADELAAEAAARMKRATDRTERALERKRLRAQAAEERRDAKEARKVKARELRAADRAGKPTVTDRVKQFVKVNAERLMVIGPITAPMAVAWTGQAGFAEDILGWVVPFTILFAAAWELSTAFVGWMYHQARQGGDAGTLYRVSTWIFALGAAVMNFWHASGQPVPGSRVWDAKAEIWTEQITYWHFTPKAVAFATMSIVGMVLWELYASLIHRRKLREDGRVAAARPSIGLVRWIRYPRHSFTAWSLAITDQHLSTLDRAWTAAETSLARRETLRAARRGVPLSRSYRVVPVSASLTPAGIPRFAAQDLAARETWTLERLETGTTRSETGPGPGETRTGRTETGTTSRELGTETGQRRALPSGRDRETRSGSGRDSRDRSETARTSETTGPRATRDLARKTTETTETETRRNTGTETETRNETRTRSETRTETETRAGTTTWSRSETGSGTETGKETETGSQSETSGRTETGKETETETTETWPHPRRETETGSRSRVPYAETGTSGAGDQMVVLLGNPETETQHLLDLMKSRGGPDKVSLDEAITETGRPKSTAAKRLAAARDRYRTLPRVPQAR